MLIGATGLQDGFFSVPGPREAESGVCLCKDGFLKLRIFPRLGAIRGDFDAPNLAAAGPSESGDFIETALGQFVSAGRKRDHRFRVRFILPCPGLFPSDEIGALADCGIADTDDG